MAVLGRLALDDRHLLCETLIVRRTLRWWYVEDSLPHKYVESTVVRGVAPQRQSSCVARRFIAD